MNKEWKNAADTYIRIAEMYESKLGEVYESTLCYESAGKAYKNCNTQEAIRCFTLACEHYMNSNNFSSAGRLWKEVASLFEREHNLEDAKQSYKKAYDCFSCENYNSNANSCLVKVASLSCETENYKDAIDNYERLIINCIDNSALRWSVKDYQFRVLLCKFAICANSNDVNSVTECCERYMDSNPLFNDTRECNLILDLVSDFKECDVDKFSEHLIFKFDEIVKLDNWCIAVLLIKNMIGGKIDFDEDLR
jgi:alpha-soluble NSF attachment protein